MSKRSAIEVLDDFYGNRVYSPTKGSNVGHDWDLADTSPAGAPTIAPVSGEHAVLLQHANTNGVENICLHKGGVLQLPIDKLIEVGFRLKLNQAVQDATSSWTVGLGTARNDDPTAITQLALFRGVGAGNITVETDDNVLDTAPVDTGKKLTNSYMWLVMNFAGLGGKGDIRFFADGVPVAMQQKFSMANYAGAFQPIIQLQKTANANTDGLVVDTFYADLRA